MDLTARENIYLNGSVLGFSRKMMNEKFNEIVEFSEMQEFLDVPMAVLVNSESISAAEFFAAALSEYDAATVVGEQTIGKGYFQQAYELSDGSAVGLSVGKYTTPNGVSLANVGITPEKENLQDVSYVEDIAGWDGVYDENGIFYCTDITQLAPQFRAILEPQGIKSMLQCSIRDNGVFRGYVGFDDCTINRFWTKEQIGMLQFLAEIMVMFLLKKRAQENLQDTVEKLNADITLFYNDYNMFFNDKRQAALALVESINTYATDENGNYRKLIDGIGMQGYIGGYGKQQDCLEDSHITRIQASINLYAKAGMQVHITEMAVRNFLDDEATIALHADFYGRLFEMFKTVNSGENKPLTCVAIWGVMDAPTATGYNYNLLSPYGGLITEKYEIKTSFDTVHSVMSK